MSIQKIALQSLNIINDLTTLGFVSTNKEETISVRVDPETMRALDERATQYDTSRARLIRRFIQEGLRADTQLNINTNTKYLDTKVDSLSRDVQAMREELAKYVRPETTRDQLPTHQKGGKKKSAAG